MGFLKRLLGGDGGDKKKASSAGQADTQGVYLYVRCDNCGTPVRLRADKQYDLINEGGGYSWHKTIVDSRCFRPIPAMVRFNGNYEVTEAEINGGQFITQAEYDEWYAARQAARRAAEESAAADNDGAEGASE